MDQDDNPYRAPQSSSPQEQLPFTAKVIKEGTGLGLILALGTKTAEVIRVPEKLLDFESTVVTAALGWVSGLIVMFLFNVLTYKKRE